ncbi:hypothetical protein IAU60_004374 [Kwoniella sp. DSM 27419]
MSPAPCNNVVGSTNLFSDEVAYANYGYEPSHAGTYAICCLVIGPTFFSAANYILLGKLIANTGKTGRPATRQYHPFSRGSSRRRGSANSEEIPMASPAAYASPSKIERGPVPMAPSQIVTDRQANLMSCLITAGTLLIVIRSVYRSTELANGWSGPIAVNEPLFLGMDALLMRHQ